MKMMKKTILLAVLLLGAGVATSKAGVAFGINIDSGRGYFGGGYVDNGCQASYGYGYGDSGQYRYTPDRSYGYGYGYGQHRALHQDLREQHGELHQDLREQHADQHYDLRREHGASHRGLREQRDYGVPVWERQAEHRAEHEAL